MRSLRAFLCRRRILRWSKILLPAVLLPCGAAGFCWHVLPRLMRDPMEDFAQETPVRTVLDASGNPMAIRRTFDYRWRMPVPPEEISPHVLNIILAAEDARFRQHSGVDFFALLRAVRQNFFHGGRISGASTITMQLAALPDAGRRKIFSANFCRPRGRARWKSATARRRSLPNI